MNIIFLLEWYTKSGSALTTFCIFSVREWHIVTVAWFQTSRLAIGEPTILLRPRTTARLPLISVPVINLFFKLEWMFNIRYVSFLHTYWNWVGITLREKCLYILSWTNTGTYKFMIFAYPILDNNSAEFAYFITLYTSVHLSDVPIPFGQFQFLSIPFPSLNGWTPPPQIQTYL